MSTSWRVSANSTDLHRPDGTALATLVEFPMDLFWPFDCDMPCVEQASFADRE
jgi:hypothetical protein